MSRPYFPESFSLLSAAAATGAIYGAWKLSQFGHRDSYLPPGPPTKPIIGNLLDFPTSAPHHKLTDWAQKYGEVYSLKLMDRTIVVISSIGAIRAILEKNSALTSDRPPYYIGEVVEGVDNDLITARYGPRWRALRRAAQQVLSPQACKIHSSIQQAESAQLLYDIINEPEDIQTHLRRTSTSVIMSVMFGVRTPSASAPMYIDFWKMLNALVSLSAGQTAPPVDLFPIMKLVPERFAKWKRDCTEIRIMERKVIMDMLNPVKERLSKGESNDCFMETVYKRAGEWGLDDEALLYFGAAMMAAGAETTSTFLTNFVLFLAANPHIQARLHDEMDLIVGSDRLPSWDDFERLPYLNATIYETHRIRPVTPLAIPHASIDEVRYGDYVIPKGTTIMQNNWALFHDKTIFDNPNEFNPERFITNPKLKEYVDFSFGSGRRICAGIHLAQSALAINAMNLIWGFTINKAVADNGTVIEPNLTDYLDGIVNSPKEVKCSLKPRSIHHEQMMRQTFHNAHSSFEPFEADLEEAGRLDAEKRRREA